MARVVVVENIGTVAERAQVHAACEASVFERQHVAGIGALPRHRATLHDGAIASFVWRALQPVVGAPADWGANLVDRIFTGVAADVTLYRYDRGESFATHRDQSIELGHGRRTLLTVLLYLPPPTGVLVGGETFVDDVAVEPRPWTVVAFAHRTWHHAAEVMAGTKVVLRGNVVIAPR